MANTTELITKDKKKKYWSGVSPALRLGSGVNPARTTRWGSRRVVTPKRKSKVLLPKEGG